MFIRPAPPYEYVDSHYERMGQAINVNGLKAGKGLQLTKGSDGTTISVTDEINRDHLTFAGTYTFEAAYRVGDVVFVDPNVTILNESSSAIPMDIPSGSSYEKPALVGGLFVCIKDVPNVNMDEVFLLSQLSLYPTIPDDLADSYRHYELNVYYPIYPSIPTSSTQWVDTGDYFTVANQNYWQALSPMLVSKMCVGNEEKTVYINGIISGSTFDMTKLPYAP